MFPRFHCDDGKPFKYLDIFGLWEIFTNIKAAQIPGLFHRCFFDTANANVSTRLDEQEGSRAECIRPIAVLWSR